MAKFNQLHIIEYLRNTVSGIVLKTITRKKIVLLFII